ncbi:60s acidic ribosomal protein [Nannochloropsis gaditana]|uniref:60s acidic ribosomal protein n=1 Tax=Nannochloropsis gaditana TaxID=72520 RepID=W7TV03_9STRA|nr:60s acidic ribosomal protein [Nannochloropsis gaditana]
MSNLTKEQKDELVTSYAALALYDGDSEVSSEQLSAFIAATGNEVEPYWPMIFSKFLGGKMEDLITSVGGGGGGGAGAAPAQDASPAADAGAKKEKKEEKEEDADLGGAMDMFGGGDGY